MPDDQQFTDRLSGRLFSLLLVLFPKQFRDAYGQQMQVVFRDYLRAARRRGRLWGLIELWGATLVDLLKTALEERVRQMMSSRSALARWAGPLTVVVGVLWAMSALGDLMFQTRLISDDSLVGLVALPFLLSFLPLFPALIGIRKLFQASIGAPGRLGLALSILGCAGLFAALIASPLVGDASIDQPSLASYGAFIGFTTIRLGLLLFGIECLKSKPMPRLNGLPLFLGSTVVLSVPFDWFGVPALVPVQVMAPFWHFFISGVCWILFGAVIPGRREPLQPVVGA